MKAVPKGNAAKGTKAKADNPDVLNKNFDINNVVLIL
jgi:hypothetical protein